MAVLRSDELYTLELYTNRGQSDTAYIDLVVLDPTLRNEIILANIINTDTKAKMMMAEMQNSKTGIVRRSEGSSRDLGHESYNIYVSDKKAFDMYDSKSEDMTNVLFVRKIAKYDPKRRQDWLEKNKLKLANGEPLLPAPTEVILAWDGDLHGHLFKVLNDWYNTPMLPEWQDYIIETCEIMGYFRELDARCYGQQHDLRAGMLQITEEQLESIITEAIQVGEFMFGSFNQGDSRLDEEGVLQHCNTLDSYLENFAGELGGRVQENSALRFDPEAEAHHRSIWHSNMHANEQGITGLYPPQADVVMGVAKTLEEENYAFIIGEPGSGKTSMGEIVPYVTEAISNRKEIPDPFRALVLVPAITVKKWKREILERIPGAKVFEIKHWTDVKKLREHSFKPTQIEYYVMSSDVSKQTYPLEPIEDFRVGMSFDPENPEDSESEIASYKERFAQEGRKVRVRPGREEVHRGSVMIEEVTPGYTGMHCPRCGNPLREQRSRIAGENFFSRRKKLADGTFSTTINMNEQNYRCTNTVPTNSLPARDIIDPNEPRQVCGFILRQPKRLAVESASRKVSPAWYINKYLRRGFFKYLIVDEVHEFKAGDTDRANAFGQLVNHTKKQILLTGTLLGGMATDIFYLLARLDPKRLNREGIGYNEISLFVQRYGVYERTETHIEGRSRVGNKTKIHPGVSPQVFPRFLMSNCAFIELSDIGYALPPYSEHPVIVEMSDEHRRAYDQLEQQIGNAMRLNVARGGMKHVSTYVSRLYQYADAPFRQSEITYDQDGEVRVLARPVNFDEHEFSPSKYYSLLNLIDEEVEEQNRKIMVYCRFTGDQSGVPMDTYLYEKLKMDGYNVGIMRSSGQYDGLKFPKPEDREKWLRDKMEKHDWDILIANSRLMAVGLDILYFPNIAFYQMDYSAYNYMQASRRSWRIKQTKPVKVYTFAYRETIQTDVLENISKKIDAAMALQGKFSEEGLRAMADSGDGINALAKKLMSEGRLDNVSSIEDRWKRINDAHGELRNVEYSGYDNYEQNPLGMERLREIQSGIVTKMQTDVASGRMQAKELEEYLAHVEEMFSMVENVRELNRGISKKNHIVEGQGELALF